MRALLSMVAVLLAAGFLAQMALADNGGFAPVAPESPNADGIRDAYLFVSIFVVGVFALVQALLVLFAIRYRRRKRAAFEDGVQVHGSTRLELLWTAAPAVVLFLIALFVFIELPGISNVPSAGARDRLEVQVTGRQFYWQFEYPNGVVAIDTLRAPAGVTVTLDVTAPDDDVIHSWWIPALGGKIDAIPGTVNETWFRVDEPGTFRGQCSELCGLAHAQMLAAVEVLPRDEFDAWLAGRLEEQSTESGSVSLGEEEWGGVCAKCHGPNGEGGIGPRIAGSPILADPNALENVVRNGRGQMPAVGSGWSREQMQALVAYLEENPPSGQ